VSTARAARRTGERWLRHAARLVRYRSGAVRGVVAFQHGLQPLGEGRHALFSLAIDFELGLPRLLAGAGHASHAELARERGLYQALLELTRRYHVPVTWALAGRLLDANAAGVADHARDLVGLVGQSQSGDEIGCHSFSHAQFSPSPDGRLDAARDLERAGAVFAAAELHPVTFIFPHNRVTHPDLLPAYGYRIYRGKVNVPPYRDPWGTWVAPLGLWIGPRALSPSDLVHAVQLGAERGALVHVWCHLTEFAEGGELVEFLEPALAMVAQLAWTRAIRPATLGQVARLLDQAEAVPSGALRVV